MSDDKNAIDRLIRSLLSEPHSNSGRKRQRQSEAPPKRKNQDQLLSLLKELERENEESDDQDDDPKKQSNGALSDVLSVAKDLGPLLEMLAALL